MDKKSTIQAVALTLLVFAGWLYWNNWYQRTHPPQIGNTISSTQPDAASSQPAVGATSSPSTTGPSTTSPSTTSPSTTGPATAPSLTAGATAPAIQARYHVVASTQPSEPVLLGSAARSDKEYAIQLALTPLGAGIDSVALNDYPPPDTGAAKQDKSLAYRYQEVAADDTIHTPFATTRVYIDGQSEADGVDLWSAPWTRESADATSATFSVMIAGPTGPVARLTKTYRITPRSAPGLGFNVSLDQSVQSLPEGYRRQIKFSMNGPTPPPAENLPPNDRSVVAAYDDAANSTIAQEQITSLEFKADDPTRNLTTSAKGLPLDWVGQASTYFAAIVQPDPASPKFAVTATGLSPTQEYDHNVAMTLTSPVVDAGSGTPARQSLHLYFVPKSRQILDTAYYAASPLALSQLLNSRNSWCGRHCTSDVLISVLVWILGIFHYVTRDWGLAIICLVLVVRALLHPITKRSQVQMMKMGKLGPEVEKLKKKYADQPDQLNREMMQLYKQQGGAILGCLPMFLQTPIWIALWTALQGTFELRQAPFLYGLTWIKDLAKPDGLVSFGGPMKILFFTVWGINILPLLMAVVTYINQKYFMPMPIAATEDQKQQQKMQRTMSIFFPLMFYGLPSGLNLYYLTSTTLGIVESKIIRKHIKEQEEAEKAGRVFVPIKPTRGAKRREEEDDSPRALAKPAGTGFMARMIAKVEELQKRAEEMQKEQQKTKRKKP